MPRNLRRLLRITVAALFISQSAPSAVLAQAGVDVSPSPLPCTLAGQVVNQRSGVPIKGVRVTLTGLSGHAARALDRHGVYKTWTDVHGAYAIVVPEGMYDLLASAPGYDGTHEPVTLQRGAWDGFASNPLCNKIDLGLLQRTAVEPHRPWIVVTRAQVDAFDASLAAQTSGCQAMTKMVRLMSLPQSALQHEPGVIEWAMTANAAKVCEAATGSGSAGRLAELSRGKACALLKSHFAQVNAVYRSQTSWACGWPAPIPQLRTVPGIMPIGYQ